MATVLSLLVQWVTWPILIAAIGRPLGWGANFVRYIVAFNWSSVYVIGVMLPPLMLFDAGVMATGIAFPTVPEGKARIRTIMTSEHTREQIARALETITTVAKK